MRCCLAGFHTVQAPPRPTRSVSAPRGCPGASPSRALRGSYLAGEWLVRAAWFQRSGSATVSPAFRAPCSSAGAAAPRGYRSAGAESAARRGSTTQGASWATHRTRPWMDEPESDGGRFGPTALSGKLEWSAGWAWHCPYESVALPRARDVPGGRGDASSGAPLWPRVNRAGRARNCSKQPGEGCGRGCGSMAWKKREASLTAPSPPGGRPRSDQRAGVPRRGDLRGQGTVVR